MLNGDPAYTSRQEAFGYGTNGGPVACSPSLAEQQQSMNASTPVAWRARGMNQQIAPSPNGTAADQAQRTRLADGSTMPTSTSLGMSDSTYQASFLRLRPKPPAA